MRSESLPFARYRFARYLACAQLFSSKRSFPHRVVFEDADAKLGPLQVREDADRVLVLRLDRPDERHQLVVVLSSSCRWHWGSHKNGQATVQERCTTGDSDSVKNRGLAGSDVSNTLDGVSLHAGDVGVKESMRGSIANRPFIRAKVRALSRAKSSSLVLPLPIDERKPPNAAAGYRNLSHPR